MKRATLNRVIDTCAFAAFVLMVTTGFLLRYLLPPGSGRPHDVGTGSGAAERLVGLLGIVAVAVLPWFSPLTSVPRSQLNEPVAESLPATHEDQMTPQTRGMMTLQEIEDLTGVPTAHILERLGLPCHVSPDERLGRLRRMYGFTMQDVRRIVVEYRR